MRSFLTCFMAFAAASGFAQTNTVVAPNPAADRVEVYFGGQSANPLIMGQGVFAGPYAAAILGTSGLAYVADEEQSRIYLVNYREGTILGYKDTPYKPYSLEIMEDGLLLYYSRTVQRGFAFDYQNARIRRSYFVADGSQYVAGMVDSGSRVVGVTSSGAKIIHWDRQGGFPTVMMPLDANNAYAGALTKHGRYLYTILRVSYNANSVAGSTPRRINASDLTWDTTYGVGTGGGTPGWRYAGHYQMGGGDGMAFGTLHDPEYNGNIVGVFNETTGLLTRGLTGIGHYQHIDVETTDPVPPTHTLALDKGAVNAGGTLFLTARIPIPAPSGGYIISLRDNTALLQTPETLLIPEGQTSGTVAVTTLPASQTVSGTITSELNFGTSSATVQLLEARLDSITLGRNSIQGGTSVGATVRLAGKTTRVREVTLTSSRPTIFVAPPSVAIEANGHMSTIVMNSNPVSAPVTVNVIASLDGVSKADSILITPAALVSLEGPATVTGGNLASFTLRADGRIGGNARATLSSSHPNLITVPSQIAFPDRATAVNFNATAKVTPADETATITAVFRGVTKTSTITVLKPRLRGISFGEEAIQSGGTTTLRVELTGPALPAGSVVAMSATPNGVLVLPATVRVPGGARAIQITVRANTVTSDQTVVARGSLVVSKTAQIIVVP